MASELPDLLHIGRLAECGISHLSDNIILLQYLRTEARLTRTVTVLKSRASAHDSEIREFDITADGIVLGDPIAPGKDIRVTARARWGSRGRRRPPAAVDVSRRGPSRT